MGTEIIIKRFGAAFGTLTVHIIKAEVVDRVRDVLSRYDNRDKFQKPNILIGEFVCVRVKLCWERAKIISVNGLRSKQKVDLYLIDAGRIIHNVSASELVTTPLKIARLESCKTYFINGLFPGKSLVGPHGQVSSSSSILSAAALNASWDPSSTATLVGVIEDDKKKIGAPIAHITISGRKLSSFLRYHLNTLRHEVVNGQQCGGLLQHKVNDSYSAWLIRDVPAIPLTSEQVFEVLYVKPKNNWKNTVEIGLHLGNWEDVYTAADFISKATTSRQKIDERLLPFHVVQVQYKGRPHRGIMDSKQRVRLIDTLELLTGVSKSRIKGIPRFLLSILPHTGLIVHFNGHTDAVAGDLVQVEGLNHLRGLEYRCSGIQRVPDDSDYKNFRSKSPNELTNQDYVGLVDQLQNRNDSGLGDTYDSDVENEFTPRTLNHCEPSTLCTQAAEQIPQQPNHDNDDPWYGCWKIEDEAALAAMMCKNPSLGHMAPRGDPMKLLETYGKPIGLQDLRIERLCRNRSSVVCRPVELTQNLLTTLENVSFDHDQDLVPLAIDALEKNRAILIRHPKSCYLERAVIITPEVVDSNITVRLVDEDRYAIVSIHKIFEVPQQLLQIPETTVQVQLGADIDESVIGFHKMALWREKTTNAVWRGQLID